LIGAIGQLFQKPQQSLQVGKSPTLARPGIFKRCTPTDLPCIGDLPDAEEIGKILPPITGRIE